jgi:hypothetical protein
VPINSASVGPTMIRSQRRDDLLGDRPVRW